MKMGTTEIAGSKMVEINPEAENVWGDGRYIKYYLEMMAEKYPESQTEREANFLEGAVNLLYGDKLLDLCSGCGRHPIAMAKRGYQVTGVDLSEGLIAHSQEKAQNSPVSDQVTFVTGDVCKLEDLGLTPDYKLVYSLASIGYHMTDEMIHNVMKGAYDLLVKGGYLVLDVINREFLLREFNEKDWTKTKAGHTCLRKTHFDFESSCVINQKYLQFPEGSEKMYHQWMRTFTLKELITFVEQNGFTYQRAYGGFKRGPYSIDSPRLMVVATREDD